MEGEEEDTKPKRSPNCNESEKSYLVEIIRDHPEIESAKYDQATIKMKQSRWEKMANSFNAHFPLAMRRNVGDLEGL